MELRYLAALAAVADEGSFGRAASRLGYTQSTVSQQIAALEKAVGGAVFDRPGGPKPVRLTPLGSVVLAKGRRLLAAAADLADAVERFTAGEGRIDIGTLQSVTSVILPVVVRRLREQYPDCDIRLSEEEPDQPQTGDLDLLFYDHRIDGAENLRLLDEPYLLVARRGTFPEDPVPVTRLDGLPMVAWPATCDQPRLEEALTRRGVRPRIMFRTASNEALLSMVRAGMGPAVLPWLALHGADAWADDRIRVHHLQPSPPPREIYLCWQAGRSHSPLAARAIDITVELANDLTRSMSG